MPPMFCSARAPPRLPEQRPVDVGHQRRALAARGHVPGAEVAHHGDAGALGDDGGLAELQRGGRGGEARAGGPPSAVRADDVHVPGAQARLGDDRQGGLGEALAQHEVELAQGARS